MRRPIRTASTYVLDLDPRCKCGNFAEFFMEVHSVGRCASEKTTASFMCKVCFKAALTFIDRVCALGGTMCEPCGLEITQPSDMLVRAVPVP